MADREDEEEPDPDEVVDDKIAEEISRAITLLLNDQFPGASPATVRAALAQSAREEGLVVKNPDEEGYD